MVEQRDFLSELELAPNSKHTKLKCKWGKSIWMKINETETHKATWTYPLMLMLARDYEWIEI